MVIELCLLYCVFIRCLKFVLKIVNFLMLFENFGIFGFFIWKIDCVLFLFMLIGGVFVMLLVIMLLVVCILLVIEFCILGVCFWEDWWLEDEIVVFFFWLIVFLVWIFFWLIIFFVVFFGVLIVVEVFVMFFLCEFWFKIICNCFFKKFFVLVESFR